MSSYLPGFNVTLNDYGLRVSPPAGVPPKLTLVGWCGNTGMPLNTPLTVTNVSSAINSCYYKVLDGTVEYRVPSELALALEQAVGAGANNLEIVIAAYTGTDAAPLSPADLATNALLPNAAVEWARYSGLITSYDMLKNYPTNIIAPLGAYIDGVPDFGKQLGDFCYQSTKEGNSTLGVIGTKSPYEWAYTNHAGKIFSGAAEALYADGWQLFGGADADDALGYVYFTDPSNALVNAYVNYHAVPTGNADSWTGAPKPTHYLAWQQGAADTANLFYTGAASSFALNANYFTYWQAVDADGNSVTDDQGNPVDAGAYLSVVTVPAAAASSRLLTPLAGALDQSVSTTTINVQPVAAYAGKIASLPTNSATTNKVLARIFAKRTITGTQAAQLVSMRHVTMFSRATGFTVAKGVTGAHELNRYVRSDFHMLSTMRIAQEAISRVKSVGEKYIGEPNSGARRGALQAEIENELTLMQTEDKLQSFSFVITSTPDQQVLGEADIAMSLVPAFELTNINVSVSLAKE
jgi:hypothetical protein